jgi:hypothetical protein
MSGSFQEASLDVRGMDPADADILFNTIRRGEAGFAAALDTAR